MTDERRSEQVVPDLLARPYWIFDMDGTLTEPVHDFAAIRAALGVPEGCDILGHLDALPEEESRRLHRALDEIEIELAGRAEASAGARRLVEALDRRGVCMGIVTRNTRQVALRVLESIGVGGYFPADRILGRHDALPKPEPDGILRLTDSWGTTGRSAVMVGDYLFDLQCGRSAGALTVHVDRTRAFHWPQFTDLAVASLEELAELVERGVSRG